MKTLFIHSGGAVAVLAASLLLAGPIGASETTASGVAPTERDARLHCEDAAERLDTLAEDKESFMAQCIADYLKNPPGDIGVDPEPGGTGY